MRRTSTLPQCFTQSPGAASTGSGFDGQRLLTGFHSPLQGSQAIIASVENPVAIFDSGAAPHISKPLQTLDLAGHGIRGMLYVAALNGYAAWSNVQASHRLWRQEASRKSTSNENLKCRGQVAMRHSRKSQRLIISQHFHRAFEHLTNSRRNIPFQR